MKKIIALIIVAVMLTATGVTAFAEVDTVLPFLFKTAKATPVIDGVKDEAYNNSDRVDVMQLGTDEPEVEGHATAVAYTLWDDTNIYVYAEVKDSTPSSKYTKGMNSWNIDSVEVYLDFKNTKNTSVFIHDEELSGQFRFCRASDYKTIDGSGLLIESIRNDIKYKVIDNGTDGYIVEASFPHKQLASKVGFSFQINDDMNDDANRDTTIFIKNLGHLACSFNYVFDTINLEGCTATNGFEEELTYNTMDDFREMNNLPPESSSAPADDSSEPAPADGSSALAPADGSSAAPADGSSAPADEPSEGSDAASNAPTESADDVKDDDSKGLDPVIWIAIAAAVVVVVAVVIVLASKGKKK